MKNKEKWEERLKDSILGHKNTEICRHIVSCYEKIEFFVAQERKALLEEVVEEIDKLSLCMGNEWSEGERYNSVQRLKEKLNERSKL